MGRDQYRDPAAVAAAALDFIHKQGFYYTLSPPPPGDEQSAGKLLTASEYGDAKRTPLKFTVQPGDNTFEIPVFSADPAS